MGAKMKKLRFLCGTHKVELANKPKQAIHCWQNGFDTGRFYYDQELWHEALPHLGCAFETAEIIITTQAVDLEPACEMLTSSARWLADTFIAMDYPNQSLSIIWNTIDRLERELSPHTEHKAWLDQQLASLYRHVRASPGDENYSVAPSIDCAPVTQLLRSAAH